jgi:hypothetical protein
VRISGTMSNWVCRQDACGSVFMLTQIHARARVGRQQVKWRNEVCALWMWNTIQLCSTVNYIYGNALNDTDRYSVKNSVTHSKMQDGWKCRCTSFPKHAVVVENNNKQEISFHLQQNIQKQSRTSNLQIKVYTYNFQGYWEHIILHEDYNLFYC